MMRIGIFDSGVGGLAIAAPIWKQFAGVELFYIADKLHAPYGGLTESQINERVLWCAEQLVKKNVEMIIVACNTATAAGVELLRKKYDFPIIGVEPDINFFQRPEFIKSQEITDLQKICVLCTPYTLQSMKFNNLKNRRDPNNLITYKAMKNLARLVEEYFWSESPSIDKKNLILEEIENEIGKESFDYLVMGCTHYELIKQIIEEFTGAKTIGVAEGIIKRCKQLFTVMSEMKHRDADSCLGFYFLDSTNSQWIKPELPKFLSWPKD